MTMIALNVAGAGAARVAAVTAAAERAMLQWQGNTLKRMATYPPAQPSNYRRTGNLGRNWRMGALSREGGALVGTVSNPTSYAGVVEGPADPADGVDVWGDQQARSMQRRAWPQIDRVAKEEWALVQAQLQASMASATIV